MSETMNDGSLSASIDARAEELFAEHRAAIFRRTDRMFAGLMSVQWAAAVATALWISPRTWAGAESWTHPHVWVALLLGGLISAFPIGLALTLPAAPMTRYSVAAGQMLMSALLIHLTGGRIETHFHVFGSLAFLAFYRDWKVFIPATIAVAGDHMWRGLFWPESVFGIAGASSWRWIEHAAWVLFENAFLITSCRHSVREMRDIARQRAQLEQTNVVIEATVVERTRELAAAQDQLRASEAWFRTIVNCAGDGLLTVDRSGRIGLFNHAAENMFGRSSAAAAGLAIESLLACAEHRSFREAFDRLRTGAATGAGSARAEVEFIRTDGGTFPAELHVSRMVGGQDGDFVVVIRDITDRRDAEQRLYDLQKARVETARKAGMADIATSVLHNVGNVLNSVNVSASLIGDQLRNSGIADLKRATAMLAPHLDDPGRFVTEDPRGRHLPRFLVELSQKLTTDEEKILVEVQSLSKGVDHIRDIVSLQQSYAGGCSFVEDVNLAELVEDAIRINSASLHRHQIEIVRRFSDGAPIRTDKQKLLQILVNLLSNAKYAAIESGRPDRRIEVSATVEPRGGVHIEVIDNGIGISEENLTRVFSYGFTTRKEGHGFGLHSAANLTAELGGTLAVESDGPGAGAKFTLKLPLVISGAKPCPASIP